jgi:hypothetical protein
VFRSSSGVSAPLKATRTGVFTINLFRGRDELRLRVFTHPLAWQRFGNTPGRKSLNQTGHVRTQLAHQAGHDNTTRMRPFVLGAGNTHLKVETRVSNPVGTPVSTRRLASSSARHAPRPE